MIDRFARPVRDRLGHPVALGLWLTRQTAVEVVAKSELLTEIAEKIADAGLVCYTMNAFPFGNFHADRVKEQVYLPDWTTDDRLRYTLDAAAILARLLPENVDGSISTSPCAFKPLHPAGADVSIYFPRLIALATALAELRSRTGKTIRLAIEPEPCCVLETTTEAIDFFRRLRASVHGRPEENAVREHLGLCYDVCHQAVEFEDVTESIRQIVAADIRIVKVHITCALELRDPSVAAHREYLARFVEPRYLHQTFARSPAGGTLSLLDLTAEHSLTPPADWLECPVWRTHFHVPIHWQTAGPLFTTRPVLEEAIGAIQAIDQTPHLEVETYTWSVLPKGTGGPAPTVDLVEGLSAELASARELVSRR